MSLKLLLVQCKPTGDSSSFNGFKGFNNAAYFSAFFLWFNGIRRFHQIRGDIYHFTAGSAFQIKGLDLTLGLSYSFGNDAVEVPGNLENPNEDSLIGDENGTVDVGYSQWLFIVGFSFSF